MEERRLYGECDKSRIAERSSYRFERSPFGDSLDVMSDNWDPMTWVLRLRPAVVLNN